GQYRWYPVIGCLTFAFGLFLMTRWDQGSGRPAAWGSALLTGLGNGMITPVILISAQNAVRYRLMGTATALVTFTRSMGQTIGGAFLAPLLAVRLTHHIGVLVPRDQRAGLDVDQLRNDPDQ